VFYSWTCLINENDSINVTAFMTLGIFVLKLFCLSSFNHRFWTERQRNTVKLLHLTAQTAIQHARNALYAFVSHSHNVPTTWDFINFFYHGFKYFSKKTFFLHYLYEFTTTKYKERSWHKCTWLTHVNYGWFDSLVDKPSDWRLSGRKFNPWPLRCRV